MNELIPINYDSEQPTVSGRYLWGALEVSTPYHKWFSRMCEYGFTENEDYVTTDKNVHRADGSIMPQTQHDHALTLPMAKELCMLQRTEKGKECRKYFIKVEEQWNSPDAVMSRALKIADRKLLEAQGRIKALEIKAEEDKPKVVFADAVATSKSCILIGDLAKLLKQNGVDTGQNRLFQWMRDNGFLMKGSSSKNMPTQRAMNMGLFEIKETTVTHSDGNIQVKKTVKVTGKGQQYFINILLSGKEPEER